MSHETNKADEIIREKTFRKYNQEQSKNYARNRWDYHDNVYGAVMDYHTSGGGRLETLVDVGCGPGLAALALAPQFEHVFGLDASEAMISTARSKGGKTSTGESVRFEIAGAEDLGLHLSPPIQDATVDLITAANAVHWFHMPSFWANAARVLRPGGSVALWTSGGIRAHPSMPDAAAIQAALDETHEVDLAPYEEPGNVLARNRYVDLPLPWTVTPPVSEFDKSMFIRKEWDVGENFFAGVQESNLDVFEKAMGTASPVTRWREAHPDDVGTERDVVKALRTKIEQILRDAGIEPGKEVLKGDVQGVLLMFKKSV